MIFGFFPKTNTPYDALAGAQRFKKTLVNLATDELMFNLREEDHLQKIRECTAAVNQHLPVLQNRDIHIAIGFGVAIGALLLSAVIPFALTIALTGVAYGAYFIGGRNDPYNKFNASLEELAHCCDWALSDVSNTDKFKNEDIKAMLRTLAPRVTKEDLVIIMGSDEEANRVIKAIEDLNAQELRDHEYANTTDIESQTSPLNLPKPVPFKLATRNDVYYHLYGYKQGGSLTTLAKVVGLFFQKAFTSICSLFGGNRETPEAPNSQAPVPGM